MGIFHHLPGGKKEVKKGVTNNVMQVNGKLFLVLDCLFCCLQPFPEQSLSPSSKKQPHTGKKRTRNNQSGPLCSCVQTGFEGITPKVCWKHVESVISVRSNGVNRPGHASSWSPAVNSPPSGVINLRLPDLLLARCYTECSSYIKARQAHTA